jgi:hypothetical protein
MRALATMRWDYWMAFVGNVAGTSGVTTTANGFTYQQFSETNKTIWLLGWSGSECQGCSDNNLNGTTGNYYFRHANYDFLNNAIVDYASGTPCGAGVACSHSLPNSFYASAQPAFFGPSGAHCTYPWPWVTPTGSTPLQTPTGVGCTSSDGLPAKARWDAGTPFIQP